MKRICELKEVNEEVMGRLLLKEIQLIITEETFSRENRKEKKQLEEAKNWIDFSPCHAHSRPKFTAQESNLSHTRNLSHSSDSAESFNC